MNTTALNLRYLRLKKMLGQQQVAESLNVKVNVISSYETGRASPPLDNLLKLAELYGVTLNDIVYDRLDETSVVAEGDATYSSAMKEELAGLSKAVASLRLRMEHVESLLEKLTKE